MTSAAGGTQGSGGLGWGWSRCERWPGLKDVRGCVLRQETRGPRLSVLPQGARAPAGGMCVLSRPAVTPRKEDCSPE